MPKGGLADDEEEKGGLADDEEVKGGLADNVAWEDQPGYVEKGALADDFWDSYCHEALMLLYTLQWKQNCKQDIWLRNKT